MEDARFAGAGGSDGVQSVAFEARATASRRECRVRVPKSSGGTGSDVVTGLPRGASGRTGGTGGAAVAAGAAALTSAAAGTRWSDVAAVLAGFALAEHQVPAHLAFPHPAISDASVGH